MRKRIIYLILLFAPSISVYAVGPQIVFDPKEATDIIQESEKISQQLENMKQQLTELRNTYQQDVEMVKDSQGHYGFGDFLNTASDLKNRQWLPNSWEESLQGLSGGNQARYKQLLQQYQSDHPSMSEDEFAQGTSKAQAQNYQENVKTNQASMSQASYEYQQINQISQQIQTLSQKIESGTNSDTKSALDLNSRLLEALANIQVEELKMQTLLNEQTAENSASNLSYDTQRASFNTIPAPQNSGDIS